MRRASARRLLCVATIAACTPYLVLKTLWVAGVAVGVYEADFLDRAAGTTFLTSLLDLCVVGLAILFVHPAGRRLPAWLLAGPTWVATGLLAPLIGGVLIGTSTQLLLGGANLLGDSAGLERWVFAVVYGGSCSRRCCC